MKTLIFLQIAVMLGGCSTVKRFTVQEFFEAVGAVCVEVSKAAPQTGDNKEAGTESLNSQGLGNGESAHLVEGAGKAIRAALPHVETKGSCFFIYDKGQCHASCGGDIKFNLRNTSDSQKPS